MKFYEWFDKKVPVILVLIFLALTASTIYNVKASMESGVQAEANGCQCGKKEVINEIFR